MTRRKQKLVERYVLDEFLRIAKLEIPIIGIDELETPDFILKCPNKKISVEHTKFLDSKQRKIEEFRKEVIDDAKRKFEKCHSENLNVYFHYTRKEMNIKHQPKSYFVDLLFNIVHDIYIMNKDREFYVSTKKSHIENQYFDRISVSNDTHSNSWQWIGGHLVEFAEIGELQKIIDKKAKLISDYQDSVDEKWLLIEAGKGYKSSSYRFNQIVKDNIIKNGFDKIFLFDSGTKEIYVLD